MNPEKRFKYSVLNKHFNSNAITYDKNKQPIIRKEELDKGLLNMVYKGLIPKGHKRQGFKELSWLKSDLDNYVKNVR